jgi:glycosyltransferase involved in cell wall biosynthesis
VKFVGAGRSYDNAAYMRDLQALCRRLQLGDAVRFLGEREDIGDLLGATDVLLAPSWEEPFGIAVGEAMLAGTPVIATSVGGPSEIIEDGVSGRLVPPRDPEPWAAAVLELARDRGARERLAAEAVGVARWLGRDRFVGEVLGAYGDVLNRSDNGRATSDALLP